MVHMVGRRVRQKLTARAPTPPYYPKVPLLVQTLVLMARQGTNLEAHPSISLYPSPRAGLPLPS